MSKKTKKTKEPEPPKQVDNEYKYYKYIKSPSEMGISVGSSLANVENGVAGIFSYVKLLVEGDSKASKTGKPLGNKFFLDTEQNCMNQNTNEKVSRSLYFDNVPSGTGGFFKDTGENFSGFRGIIPGAVEDILSIGQIDFFAAFNETSMPKCLPVKLKTIDVNNKGGYDTQYITISDIEAISPCNFYTKTNPVNGNACDPSRQGFTMSHDDTDDDNSGAELYKDYYKLNEDDDNDTSNGNKKMKLMMPDDVFLKILFYSLGALSVYVALKLMANMYKKRD